MGGAPKVHTQFVGQTIMKHDNGEVVTLVANPFFILIRQPERIRRLEKEVESRAGSGDEAQSRW